MEKNKEKKPGRFSRIILIIVCVFLIISVTWTVFSLTGRIDAGAVIPGSAVFRVSISNPIYVIDGIIAHESMHDISAVPALAQAAPTLHMLNENPLLKNFFVRLALRGKFELALLPSDTEKNIIAAAWDMGIFSPLFRFLPVVSGFVNIPNFYYVRAGSNSRFEYRTAGITLFIGHYRNLLFVTSSSEVFASRSANASADTGQVYRNINPSEYDVLLLLSNEFIYDLFAEQDPRIAAILDNIDFESGHPAGGPALVEAGISIFSRKIEFYLAAPVSSQQNALSGLLGQRSQTPVMAERFPSSVQYATILSAGTLEELYQAALVFSGPDLDDTLRMADSSARMILGLTLDDLLFSWSGEEFAVFGMEGRPHPVFAIQISDERKRQEVFDRAFRSIFINEDVRLNLDGTRMPRVATPEFLQSLLRKWDIFLPSPYYTIYRDFLLISESADTLLYALRAMQRNDVLPRNPLWRDIAGGKPVASAFSLYYSLDLSMPFFLRKNTALSSFLSLYRQGLIRISFDRGLIDLSVSLVPGQGNGVILVGGFPLDTGGRQSNEVFGGGRGANSRIFFASGNSVFSVDLADNSIHVLEGQGRQWIIPADGIGRREDANAWVVSDRGRVTLVDGNLEPALGFPVLTGLRLSSPPKAHEGRLYICDEDGKVHVVNEHGALSTWETSFIAAIRSPPSFLTVSSRGRTRNYAAVYPKSFFGEIWLLDTDGKALPGWPAPISIGNDEFSVNTGIGFGSPLLFAHNNRVFVAFVCQTGELLVYDENASRIPPFPLYLNGIFYLQPVFDGQYLWLISSNGTLFRIGLDGELLYQHIPGFSVMEEGFITVFDFDGDRIPEIFITGEGNALHGFTRSFRSLEGFPLPVWGRPHFVEAQGSFGSSRKAEIFGMGMDRRLYRWQFR
jgi:hypothetical protein